MSDHISGPRALSDPIADITDVYAFPSPERPGPPGARHEHAAVRQADGPLLGGAALPLPAAAAHPAHRRAARGAFVPGDEELRLRLRVRLTRAPTGRDHVAARAPARRRAARTVRFRVNDEAGGSAAVSGSSPASGGTRSSWTPRPRWRRIATAQARVHRPRVDLPRRQERPEPRRRDRHRAAAGRAAGRRRRRDPDPRRVQRPDRTRRSTRGQEHDAGPEAVRPGQPRPGDPRPLQHGGRVQPR